ncbi:hypothetical protein Micbo1qcDRAFT_223463, partial [Microdochium bolleyi]
GQWLLSDTRFTKWRDGSGHRLLCSGIPGAGKTVLASIAIRDLQSISRNGSRACVYVYFNHREPERENLRKVVLSLLAQLVHLQGETYEPSQAVKEVHDRFRLKGMHPTLSESIDILEAEVKVYSRVYLVVDAVDECSDNQPHSNREEFLHFVRGLPDNVSVLLTSRPDEGIRRRVKADCEIPVKASADDLRSYIETRLDSRGRTGALIRSAIPLKGPGYKDSAINRVIEKSEGM